MAATCLVVCLTVQSTKGQAQPAEQRESSYLYSTDALASSKLPDALVAHRRDEPLFLGCEPPESRAVFETLLVGVVVAAFKALLKTADAALKAQEKKRLDALSHSASATSTGASFPLASGARKPRCLAFDRIVWEKDRIVAESLYVFRLEPVGSTAFTIELVAAKTVNSTLIGKRGLPATLNADIGLAFTTVQLGVGGTPEQRALPAYTASVKGLDPARPGVRPESERHISAVIPVPSNGTPTTIVATVTESNAGLDKEKERAALQQSIRGKLIELAGGAVEAALK